MANKAVFIYSDELLNYRFPGRHPFNQKRIQLTLDLLKTLNAIKDEQIIPPRIASDEELSLVHDERFINTVKKAENGQINVDQLFSYGLGTEDTPVFPKIHEASARVVGGTLVAAEYVMEGKANHALHLGGGLHHSLQGRASGFCIYNDCAVAIRWIVDRYDAKVLYIDTDAHHGDGVQWAFYDYPNVCTVSIHETGKYLFPGTGNIYERGYGKGYGYSFNIPLEAFTEDDSWLEAYETAVWEIAEYFKPDILITQNGADAHYYDPLTHLSTTMKIYRKIPQVAKQIAETYCEGRWIALGGGGYDIWRVVPRAWAMIWIVMTGFQLQTDELPKKWLVKWQKEADVKLPETWDDPANIYPPIPRKKEIEEKNRQTVDKVLNFIHKKQKL
ncbi:MAG: acetoin utilization protein AcuC [Caldibacillus sp.]